MQAVTLMEAMVQLRLADELAEAYVEAWERGPHWREAIHRSLRAIEPRARDQIFGGLAISVERLDLDPAEFGLSAP